MAHDNRFSAERDGKPHTTCCPLDNHRAQNEASWNPRDANVKDNVLVLVGIGLEDMAGGETFIMFRNILD